MKPHQILFKIWIVISTISTVISLASFTDGIVSWVPFIKDLIRSYREITDLIWGNLFALFNIALPQIAHDYLTLNSLFSVSIMWGLYNSNETLGFKLGSVGQFLKNNLARFSVADSSLKNFENNARNGLQKNGESISTYKEEIIRHVARIHRTYWLVVSGVLSIILFIILYTLCSFPIPILMKWQDVIHHKVKMNLLKSRRAELTDFDLSDVDQVILNDAFERSCMIPCESEIQIIRLYHSELRKSLLWYLVTVIIVFMLVVFVNYVGTTLVSA